MPGPLSSMTTTYSSFSVRRISTPISGSISASPAASSPLSTASLTAVSNARVGESYPRICLFRSKNSETEISRCFFASSSAIEIDGTLSHPFGRANRGTEFKHSALQPAAGFMGLFSRLSFGAMGLSRGGPRNREVAGGPPSPHFIDRSGEESAHGVRQEIHDIALP